MINYKAVKDIIISLPEQASQRVHETHEKEEKC